MHRKRNRIACIAQKKGGEIIQTTPESALSIHSKSRLTYESFFSFFSTIFKKSFRFFFFLSCLTMPCLLWFNSTANYSYCIRVSALNLHLKEPTRDMIRLRVFDSFIFNVVSFAAHLNSKWLVYATRLSTFTSKRRLKEPIQRADSLPNDTSLVFSL